jgi:hypothetical protein
MISLLFATISAYLAPLSAAEQAQFVDGYVTVQVCLPYLDENSRTIINEQINKATLNDYWGRRQFFRGMNDVALDHNFSLKHCQKVMPEALKEFDLINKL